MRAACPVANDRWIPRHEHMVVMATKDGSTTTDADHCDQST